ncbi:MAG: hypothetical protein GZ094_13430 [Mariniphaga sp.]|nr:hypothetical protein [Mariniphaga sp.]
MNKKLKFEKLLSGEDNSILLFKPIVMHFAARHIGATYGKFASDYKVLVESNIRCMETFDFDSVSLISDPYRETSAFGARIKYLDEGVPQCLDKLVNSVEDARNLQIPDLYKCERTLDRIMGAAHYQKLLKGTVPVGGWIEGPLAEACDLAGLSEMMMNLMCDPDYTNFLMDKCMVVAKDFAKAQINEGCDYIGIGDAICSQIDAETYSTYVKDRHKELVDHIHSLGSKAKLHICGDINHLLPSISELNLDIIDFDWQVDLIKAREILGEKIVFKGNINPIFIQDASTDEISKLATSLVTSQKGTKFILSGGCELSVYTPHENIKALRQNLK